MDAVNREVIEGKSTVKRPTNGSHPQASEIEVDAERMLLGIDALVLAGVPEAALAERYATRLRFALGRVDELKRAAIADGGAFAPARLEVATWILESHVHTSAAFINRTVRQAKRTPGRRSAHAEVNEAIEFIEQTRRHAA